MLLCGHKMFSVMLISSATVVIYVQLQIVSSLLQAERMFSESVAFSETNRLQNEISTYVAVFQAQST